MAARKYAKYQNTYKKEKVRVFKLQVNRRTEPKLLDWLEGRESIQGYLKALVCQDMENQKTVKQGAAVTNATRRSLIEEQDSEI